MFPFVVQAYWLPLVVRYATTLIVIAMVCLLQNQYVPLVLQTFRLSLGGVCDSAHGDWWGALASEAMLSHRFYKHVWLSLEVMFATALIVITGVQTCWLSLWVLFATALIVIAGVRLLQN